MNIEDRVAFERSAQLCLEAAAKLFEAAGLDWHQWMKHADLAWQGQEGLTTQEKEKERKKQKKKD